MADKKERDTFLQCCQIFLGTIYQNGKTVENGHKIYQMALKYTELQ
jgi:hypothetical protein